MDRMNIRGLSLLMICVLFMPPSISFAEAGNPSGLTRERLSPIAEIVNDAIRSGKMPGAVVLIGDSEGIIYREAFGNRSIEPRVEPMGIDTIFDIASLTKTVATATAVMQLFEKGKIGLDQPAARYWPAFKANGKGRITVRHLLTHYSGLRADLPPRPKWSGYKKAMEMIIRERPVLPPGSGYIYSDINFAVLGEIVRRVSGKTLDRYCKENIFHPLAMHDTTFRPEQALSSRIAPTERRNGKMLCGETHDPSCHNMGGVAGHAGLFSSADNLAIFATMLLRGGSLNGVRVLSPRSIVMMTTPQSPPQGNRIRGLGWDIEAPIAANRDELPSEGSYGHLGYTGTALWIDPVTGIYIIVLTNRVHPDGKGDVRDLRAGIKKTVAEAIGLLTCKQVLARAPWLKESCDKEKKQVRTGIDVLAEGGLLPLKGLRVGLITNQTGVDSQGRRTFDLLSHAREVKLMALFSPEHGFSGLADMKVASSKDPATNLPIYSLYGDVLSPTADMLEGLDALVFDIQDAGVRFYTYISTMAYAMEAAAKKGLKFFVLDRPNPINASSVQGPVLDRDLRSFTGYFQLPVRHGMTVGELAKMFNEEENIGVNLTVIRMEHYSRSDWFDETGLCWINPSPNLRSLRQAILYPGVAMAEGANVSVGRGTDSPFELLGAPWMNSEAFASYLNGRMIRGVSFTPEEFTPSEGIYKGNLCHGARIRLEDRDSLDTAVLGIEIVSALYKLYPSEFLADKTLSLIGSRKVLDRIREGQDPHTIALAWQDRLEEFRKTRAKYLLY